MTHQSRPTISSTSTISSLCRISSPISLLILLMTILASSQLINSLSLQSSSSSSSSQVYHNINNINILSNENKSDKLHYHHDSHSRSYPTHHTRNTNNNIVVNPRKLPKTGNNIMDDHFPLLAIKEIEILTEPQVLHINVDQVGSFKVFVNEKLEPDQVLHLNLRCSLGKCNTFHNTFEPVVLNSTTSSVMVNFTPTIAGHDDIDLVLDFNKSINIQTIKTDNAYVVLRVGRSSFLTILGFVFGWLYFVTWSVSFWPQNITNYKRKSVIGLSFDYTILHFTGFLFYVIFNVGLYGFDEVQKLYELKYPRSEIPVELNDVVYAAHAALSTSITWGQCFIYERGNQRVSIYGRLFQCAIWSIGSLLLVLSIMHVLNWLQFIYYFSYVKLAITSLKYLPQVYFNYQRKSTAGWSIYMIYLDIMGGSTSMLQMIINAFNYNDWTTLIGNLPKLGLSIASITYDIVFLLQEFVFYPQSKRKQPDIEKPYPLEYDDSDNSSQTTISSSNEINDKPQQQANGKDNIRRLSNKLTNKLTAVPSNSDSHDKLCPSTSSERSPASSCSSTPSSSIVVDYSNTNGSNFNKTNQKY